LPKSTKARSHGNIVCDVIIAHMISADAQIDIKTDEIDIKTDAENTK